MSLFGRQEELEEEEYLRKIKKEEQEYLKNHQKEEKARQNAEKEMDKKFRRQDELTEKEIEKYRQKESGILSRSEKMFGKTPEHGILDRWKEEYQQAAIPGTPEYRKWKARENAIRSAYGYPIVVAGAGIGALASTEVGKLAKTLGREAYGYIPRKAKEARKNIQQGNLYRDYYRESRKQSMPVRAVTEEQRKYREKVSKEALKYILEEERQRNIVAAEKEGMKAAQIERAKIQTRQRYGLYPTIARPNRPQIQMYGLQTHVESKSNRVARQLGFDPSGVYSLGSGKLQLSDAWMELVGMPSHRQVQTQSTQPAKNGTKKRGRWMVNWSTLERYWVPY